MTKISILDEFRDKVRGIAAEHGLNDAVTTILAKSLTPEEAIGTPGRRDFPILKGRERVIEAEVLGARGQAFTDSASEFQGRLHDVLEMPLDTHRNRALFLAATNAMLAHLGLVEGTVHCKDDAPEKCAAALAESLRRTGAQTIGLIGLNPALGEAIVREFGAASVRITDLNPQNIGKTRFGVVLWDGRIQTADLIEASELVVVTGTTLVNGTFDNIAQLARASGKRLIVFGITAAGVCRLMNVERWCTEAQDG